MQSFNSSLIFLNLTSYFGGIRPIVVFVDKICRRDKTIDVSRNLLVMAPSISYIFLLWIYFSIGFFTMSPNKFKLDNPFLLYKGKRNLWANLFFFYLWNGYMRHIPIIPSIHLLIVYSLYVFRVWLHLRCPSFIQHVFTSLLVSVTFCILLFELLPSG